MTFVLNVIDITEIWSYENDRKNENNPSAKYCFPGDGKVNQSIHCY
jgi:hypothetical protein